MPTTTGNVGLHDSKITLPSSCCCLLALDGTLSGNLIILSHEISTQDPLNTLTERAMSQVVLGLNCRWNALSERPTFHPAQTSDRLWFGSEASRCVTGTRCPKARRVGLRTHCLGVAESTAAVQKLLNLALAGDFDGLLEYVPDAAVEHALQRKKIFRLVLSSKLVQQGTIVSAWTSSRTYPGDHSCRVRIICNGCLAGAVSMGTVSAFLKWQ